MKRLVPVLACLHALSCHGAVLSPRTFDIAVIRDYPGQQILAVSDDGKRIAYAEFVRPSYIEKLSAINPALTFRTQVEDVATGKAVASCLLTGVNGYPSVGAFSPDGNAVYLMGGVRWLHRLDTETGRLVTAAADWGINSGAEVLRMAYRSESQLEVIVRGVTVGRYAFSLDTLSAKMTENMDVFHNVGFGSDYEKAQYGRNFMRNLNPNTTIVEGCRLGERQDGGRGIFVTGINENYSRRLVAEADDVRVLSPSSVIVSGPLGFTLYKIQSRVEPALSWTGPLEPALMATYGPRMPFIATVYDVELNPITGRPLKRGSKVFGKVEITKLDASNVQYTIVLDLGPMPTKGAVSVYLTKELNTAWTFGF